MILPINCSFVCPKKYICPDIKLVVGSSSYITSLSLHVYTVDTVILEFICIAFTNLSPPHAQQIISSVSRKMQYFLPYSNLDVFKLLKTGNCGNFKGSASSSVLKEAFSSIDSFDVSVV